MIVFFKLDKKTITVNDSGTLVSLTAPDQSELLLRKVKQHVLFEH